MSDIRGFREIVGPDGEVTFEFDSSSGDSESEEDLDYIPPAAALARRNAIPNLDIATDWAEQEEGSRRNVSDSESGDSEVILIPAAGSMEPLTATIGEDGATAGPSFAVIPPSASLEMPQVSERSAEDSDEDESIPSRSVVRRTRNRRTRRPRRKPKRVAAKKGKPVPKKRVVQPKILPPLTVRHDVAFGGVISEYKKIMKSYKVRIHKNSEDEKGYKIGSIELQLEQPFTLNGTEPENVPSFTSDTVRDVVSEVVSLEFSMSNDRNVVLIKKERAATEAEAMDLQARPPHSYKKREFNFIIVEHYYFTMEVRGDLPVELFDGLRNKSLRLDLRDYDAETQTFRINIMLLESSILGTHDLRSVPAPLHGNRKNLLCFLFGVENAQKIEPQEKEDIEWFYGQVKKYHRSENLKEADVSLQHASMKPTLRDYQKAAVQWMLHKEGAIKISDSAVKAMNIIASLVEKVSVPVKILDGEEEKTAYYNPYVGCVSWERPLVPPLPSGGILADEMGLGKTVEVLAVILLNPCPDFGGDSQKTVVKAEEDGESSDEASDSSSSSDCPVPWKKSKKKNVSKRRKRSPSPCEYVAHNFDENDEENAVAVTSPHKRKSRVIESSEDEDNASQNLVENDGEEASRSSPLKRRRRSTKDEQSGAEPSTYDKVKVLYDAALSEFSALNAHRPKFHGTFFETTIQKKACFECLCGEGLSDRRKVLRCTRCLSSQHAECVNFDRSRGEAYYLCPHCEVSSPPIDVKTTLIVTPTTISHQWINEIQRHIKNKHMNILFYKGVAKHGYFPPYRFAEYDLVITTYAVLSADLNYVDLPHLNSEGGRKFRNAKRFLTIPSSLPAVRWWRVCLDEAQMVEGMATKMAAMASRLQGVHRWCVTGTPLNKGLEDLHGLFAFLGVSPLSDDLWWEFLVRVPFYKKDTTLLFELFGQLIWRTGKQSVLNQLGIPPQEEIFHWLQFSPVEAHFYKRQYDTCSMKINAKIARLRQINGPNILQCRLSALDRQTLHSLLQPFLELRQACCHPQMVRGNVINLQKLKGTLTMEQLLEQLIKKTKIQCMDDHRLIVAALNGLAGLYMLSSRWREAADSYREVLQSAEKHKEQFQTDSLQLLHALENLADILDGSHVGVGYTINDSKLRPQAAEIREKYLEKYAQAVTSAKNVVDEVTNQVVALMENFCLRNESWWVKALQRALKLGKDEDLISRIKDDLTYKAKMYKQKSTSIANKFNAASGLEFLLIEKIQELEQTRDDVLGGLDKLMGENPSTFVEQAVYCHLRGQVTSYYNENNTGFRCELCKYHDRFLEYESQLFSAIENMKISRTGRNRQLQNFAGNSAQDLTPEERAMILLREQEELLETTEHVNVNMLLDQRRQTWADSEIEKIMKALLGFAKLNGCPVSVIDDGTNHVKLFEAMKKEFRLLRVLWRQVFDQVSAIDELSQATTRLRIREENEAIDTVETKRKKSTIKALSSGITEKADKIMNIHVLQRHEIDLKIEQIKGDYETGQDSLAVHLGQLFYLENLNKNGYGKKGAFNSDDCPVCTSPLGHQWCVLICGHSYCSDCIKELGNRNPVQAFQCPLCRAQMKMSAVSFIDTRVEDDQPVAGPSTSSTFLPATKPVEVKGSHSTKVEKVVETLLRLQESHPGEKVLVFSTWTDVLEIVGHALEQNDIKYCMLVSTSKNKFHETIERFKSREDVQALLIPIQSGSKGLNLIEATHVLLVEPIFNLASEAQAIGRVHRIGQTKPTYVHRFYIRNTIEEHLFGILRSHDVSSDEEGLLTVADLQQLVTQGTTSLMPRNLDAPAASQIETVDIDS